ncbi:MAG: hypothetical protein JW929_14605 [Anaerolineales bacterium]|nr:hypothetical protein [Anaerolineales bacterium]
MPIARPSSTPPRIALMPFTAKVTAVINAIRPAADPPISETAPQNAAPSSNPSPAPNAPLPANWAASRPLREKKPIARPVAANMNIKSVQCTAAITRPAGSSIHPTVIMRMLEPSIAAHHRKCPARKPRDPPLKKSLALSGRLQTRANSNPPSPPMIA